MCLLPLSGKHAISFYRNAAIRDRRAAVASRTTKINYRSNSQLWHSQAKLHHPSLSLQSSQPPPNQYGTGPSLQLWCKATGAVAELSDASSTGTQLEKKTRILLASAWHDLSSPRGSTCCVLHFKYVYFISCRSSAHGSVFGKMLHKLLQPLHSSTFINWFVLVCSDSAHRNICDQEHWNGIVTASSPASCVLQKLDLRLSFKDTAFSLWAQKPTRFARHLWPTSRSTCSAWPSAEKAPFSEGLENSVCCLPGRKLSISWLRCQGHSTLRIVCRAYEQRSWLVSQHRLPGAHLHKVECN